jgi:hypothetical protein
LVRNRVNETSMDLQLADIELICETATWCFSRCNSPPFSGTERFTPDCLRGTPVSERLHRFATSSLVDAVLQVAEPRRQQLVELPRPFLAGPNYEVLWDFRDCLFLGRLFRINVSSPPRKSDCLEAASLSQGFFDPSGLPVWDSWAFARNDEQLGLTLYGWAPNEVASFVGNGMWQFSNNFAEWIEP